jgi:hypothetical protein
MTEDYYHTCQVCGKRYYRKYESDHPEDYWWLSISRSLGWDGVCSEKCARETVKYVDDKRKVMSFYDSLFPDQQAAFHDVWDILHYDYDGYETSSLLCGEMPEEKVHCFTCRRIVKISETVDIGGGRQCHACHASESEL